MLLRTLASVLALSLGACAAPPRRTPYTPSYSAPAPVATTVVHEYKVSAVDASGQPLPGVTVKLGLEGGKHTAAQTHTCTTDEQGHCPAVPYHVTRDLGLTYVKSYMSTAKAEGSKDGYYPAKGSGFSSRGSDSSGSSTTTDIKLRMVRPTDYLDDNLAQSTADRELRERVLKFLEVIRLQSLLNDAEVMLKGIGTSEFKGKKYLRVRVNSTTTYNSLKLDKYAVGKRLFDDTVRKVLSPLNEAIAAPRAYYGYDLVVYGHSKSFADKYANADKLEFRFLMPEASVRKYKDKDISGQALLDASVLLLDDERIDMKLQ